MAKGLKPDVVCGHSVGEYVAATVAGVLTVEDGLKLIAARGAAMADCDPSGGVMVAVRANEATLTKAMDRVIATEQVQSLSLSLLFYLILL